MGKNAENWDVYDDSGKKVGEVRPSGSPPPSTGCGCGFGTIVVLGILSVLVWPAILSGFSSFGLKEKVYTVLWIASMAIDVVIHGILMARKRMRFMDVWVRLTASATISAGTVMVLLSAIAGEMDFLILIGAYIISFFLAVIPCVLGAAFAAGGSDE